MTSNPAVIAQIAEYRRAMAADADTWVAACGGLEEPYRTRDGRRVQYVYNPCTGEHAYYDLGADLILDNTEVDWM